MTPWLANITLQSKTVTLAPLEEKHADELAQASSDGDLSQLWFTSAPSGDTVHKYIQHALQEKTAGKAYPFVVIHNGTGKIIGSTRYYRADSANRRVEIGYTWYAQSFWQTAVNTECKFLLLQYAFETLNCIAVEFRTHWHNRRSRNAIAKLGAKQDGVLRNEQIDAFGNYRDTVVFSILESEWGVVKKNLEFRLS